MIDELLSMIRGHYAERTAETLRRMVSARWVSCTKIDLQPFVGAPRSPLDVTSNREGSDEHRALCETVAAYCASVGQKTVNPTYPGDRYRADVATRETLFECGVITSHGVPKILYGLDAGMRVIVVPYASPVIGIAFERLVRYPRLVCDESENERDLLLRAEEAHDASKKTSLIVRVAAMRANMVTREERDALRVEMNRR